MEELSISFDHSMRELFEYPDPSVPFIVWKGDFSLLPNRAIDCHWHNEFEYGVLLSGEVSYYIDGQYVRMRKGDAVFINANVLHMAKPIEEAGEAVIFTVSFLPSLLTGGNNGTIYKKCFQPILQSRCRGLFLEASVEECKSITELLCSLYGLNKSETEHYELVCIAIVCRLWEETLKYSKNHSNVIQSFGAEQRYENKTKDAISFIHEHFADDIRIEDITKHIFISRSELFRSFQHYMNQSPIEYLVEYRLAQAANLLMKTTKPITRIAIECGFSGASYFGKAFKKKYGLTPLKFRNSLLHGS